MFRGRNSFYLCLLCVLPTLLHSAAVYAEPAICHTEITQISPVTSEADTLMPIEYIYDVTFDERCQLRAIPEPNEVMDCKRPQTDLKQGNRLESLNAHVTVECVYRRPGFYYLPPVRFELTAPDNSIQTFHPNLYRLKIPYRKDFHDTDIAIENTLVLLSWSRHLRHIWRILLAVIIGILAFTILYFRRQKNKEFREKPDKEQSPIEEFMAEIQSLQVMSPVSMEDYKQFHDKLSQGVKTYISRRLKTDVMSCTSMQVCNNLSRLGVSTSLCDTAKRLLKSSACVRFAQYIPKYSDNLEILNQTKELVENLESFAKEKDSLSKHEQHTHDDEIEHTAVLEENAQNNTEHAGIDSSKENSDFLRTNTETVHPEPKDGNLQQDPVHLENK